MTKAQLRHYRRGIARGKKLAAQALHRQRVAAAKKAAKTRAKKKLHRQRVAAAKKAAKTRAKKKKEPKEKPPVGEVSELVLFRATEAEKLDAFTDEQSFLEALTPTVFDVELERLVDGAVVDRATVTIDPAFSRVEPFPRSYYRIVREFVDRTNSQHPEWGAETAAAALVRLTIKEKA